MKTFEEVARDAVSTDRNITGQCPHCLMDKKIRNPSGYCDHLYYPENCDTCKQRDDSISYTTSNFIGKRHGK